MMNETVCRLMDANLLGVFNERDGKRRAAAIRSTYAPDVRWTDDEGVSVGHDALEARAQNVPASRVQSSSDRQGAPRYALGVAHRPSGVHRKVPRPLS